MRIAITGSTGLIGSEVVDFFQKSGHYVLQIVRPSTRTRTSNPTAVWDINHRKIDLQALENLDALVHLAGANLADHRWTSSYKEQILLSRLESTTFLASCLPKLQRPPRVLISASAIGYYGSQPASKIIDESSKNAESFLAKVCKDWEKATKPAEVTSVRVIHARFGMVVSEKGGALAKMLPIFKAGLGGPIGSGQQIMSWIALKEIPMIMSFLLESNNVYGPVNFVSPDPVSNAEFTKTLSRHVHKPAIFPLPGFAARLMFGEMADELLLSGARVFPRRLKELGYQFRYPTLESIFRTMKL